MSTIWGPYLYQRDADLDILDLIANEAARMFLDPDSLRCPLMPEYFSLRSPIDKDSVIQELNGGVFQRLLRRFKHADLDMAVVLTAAVGMELGVRFLEEDMLMVRVVVMKAEDLGVERRGQMVEALEGYGNDGREWVFRRMGVKKGVAEDRLDASGDEEEAVAGARGGEFALLNSSGRWDIDTSTGLKSLERSPKQQRRNLYLSSLTTNPSSILNTINLPRRNSHQRSRSPEMKRASRSGYRRANPILSSRVTGARTVKMSTSKTSLRQIRPAGNWSGGGQRKTKGRFCRFDWIVRRVSFVYHLRSR